MWADYFDTASFASTSNHIPRFHLAPRHCGGNIFNLLMRRALAPRSKALKSLWSESSEGGLNALRKDAKRGIISWVETESLCLFSAKCFPLEPSSSPIVTIAFNLDGKILASTHVDLTIKIIDCQSGNCLRVLSGHRKTPHLIKFHPTCPGLLASASLDNEVRLWDANTTECIRSRYFGVAPFTDGPVRSIAFHAQGELLAVTFGSKLYIWHFNEIEDLSTLTVVLETQSPLLAVHFHPLAAPFLLTAELNHLDSSDSSMTLATSQGYVPYPPPPICVLNFQYSDCFSSTTMDNLPLTFLPIFISRPLSSNEGKISFQHLDGIAGQNSISQRFGAFSSARLLTYSTLSGQYELILSPLESISSSYVIPNGTSGSGRLSSETEVTANMLEVYAMNIANAQPEERSTPPCTFLYPTFWDLPFLHGWVISPNQESSFGQSDMLNQYLAWLAMQTGARGNNRPSSRHRASPSHEASSTQPVEAVVVPHDDGDPQPFISRIQSLFNTLLEDAAVEGFPCTVKLRIWPYNVNNPCAALETDKCCLTIPHVVLYRETGVHFSPCGKFLAACVACMPPQEKCDSGIQMQTHLDVSGAAPPTRNPISGQPIIYELRIYSLEEATFGLVLASRTIRAADCLTSIQFSPTSEHLLLAYRRPHISLIKNIFFNGEASIPVYAMLEVYRVSDMELVSFIPGAVDGVNEAFFHPSAGSGLAYGTMEGKLGILQYDNSSSSICMVPNFVNNCFLKVRERAL